MTQTPAAGWFVDPEDATQFRYWDGSAWTEHRSPRGPATTDQLNQAAGRPGRRAVARVHGDGDLGQPEHRARPQPGVPTFASVAASCRDEPARQPLSVNAQLVLAPTDLAGVAAVFAQTQTVVTAEGVTLDNELCRLVPNPWNPATPNGVAVFVGDDDGGPAAGRPRGDVLPAAGAADQQGAARDRVADLWAQGGPARSPRRG